MYKLINEKLQNCPLIIIFSRQRIPERRDILPGSDGQDLDYSDLAVKAQDRR